MDNQHDNDKVYRIEDILVIVKTMALFTSIVVVFSTYSITINEFVDVRNFIPNFFC